MITCPVCLAPPTVRKSALLGLWKCRCERFVHDGVNWVFRKGPGPQHDSIFLQEEGTLLDPRGSEVPPDRREGFVRRFVDHVLTADVMES